MRWSAQLAFALCWLGCGDSAPAATPQQNSGELREARMLLDHSGWVGYDAALDPLFSHQPAQIECGPSGWYVERGALEIETARCNYALLEHPALTRVTRGERIELELRHFDLRADAPASAHVAVLFVDAVQWELEIPIPGPAEAMRVTFAATRDLARDEPIRLHLHNHGQNSWALVSLTAY